MKSRSASWSSTRVVVLVGSLVRALILPAVRGVSWRAFTLNTCQSTTLIPRERAMRSLVSTDPALSSWNSSRMRAVVVSFIDTTAQLSYSFHYGNIPECNYFIVETTLVYGRTRRWPLQLIGEWRSASCCSQPSWTCSTSRWSRSHSQQSAPTCKQHRTHWTGWSPATCLPSPWG